MKEMMGEQGKEPRPEATLTASYQAYSFTTYWNRWGCRPGQRKRHPAFRPLFGTTLVLDTLR
ncbi:hypothetical protein ACQWHU_26130, partial [Salmonella enterica subsp. enterica serovar Infantis]